MLRPKLEKSVYINGVLQVITSSNSWRVMQPTRLLQMTATIGTLPTGTGSTIVRAVKNNDPGDELFAVEFTEGGNNLLSDSGEQVLAAGDTVQLIIPQIADTTAGTDLLVQFLFITLP